MRIIQRLIAWSSSRRISYEQRVRNPAEPHRTKIKSIDASQQKAQRRVERDRHMPGPLALSIVWHDVQPGSPSSAVSQPRRGRFRTKLDYARLDLSHSHPLRAVNERRAVRYIGFKLEELRKVDEPHIRLAGMESASAKPPIPSRKVGLRSSSTTSPISIFRFRLCPRQRVDDVQNNFSI